ncbi:MAG: hypothetical protein WCW17_02605 [Patescibacteria group bacterium]|jgi:hypothetical protein
MKAIVRVGVVLVALVGLARIVDAKLNCEAKQKVVWSAAAKKEATKEKLVFAFKLRAADKPISLRVTTKTTTLIIGKKTTKPPVLGKWYDNDTVQYQSDVRILLVRNGNKEIQVSVLPHDTPRPKGAVIHVGKHDFTQSAGNTDSTYMYIYRVPSRDKHWVYEISQDLVESKEVLTLLCEAVNSFTEVTK